jgi:hypothetical protein
MTRPMMYDTETRRMVPACCDACAHSHPSSVATSPCSRGARMGEIAGTTITTAPSGLAVPVVFAAAAYGAVVGGLAGTVAQDRGKRLRGTAWGALTGAIVGTISGGLIAFAWKGGNYAPTVKL